MPARSLLRRRPSAPFRGASGWIAAVPVIALVAGLMFAVSSRTAGGSDLRSDRVELTQVIIDREHGIAVLEAQRKQLQDDVDQLSDVLAAQNDGAAQLSEQTQEYAAAAGLTPVHGPAVRVTLTDAPLGPDGQLPAGARPDDVVIHQSDLQGVVNAMWSAGADAVMIQGNRIIMTTAIRCVGNTLLLAGKVYSPPFVIVAIGDQAAIEKALQNAPGVKVFLDAVDAFGLGYQVSRLPDVTIPAYDGPIGVSHASVAGR